MASSSYSKLEQLLKVYINNVGHRLDIDELNECLQPLSSEQISEIVVQARNGSLVSAIHLAAHRGHTEVVSSILNSVTQTARDELISLQSKKGQTALHRAAWAGDSEIFQLILELVSPEKRFELIMMRNRETNTAVHLAAFRRATEIMMSLLKVLSPSERVSVLSSEGKAKYTAIHYAALVGNTETLKSIMDFLASSDQAQLHVLDIRDADNRTPQMLAQYKNKQETAEFLKQCREAAESNLYETVQSDTGNTDLLNRFQRAEVEWIKHMTELTNEIAQLKECTNEIAQLRECNAHLTKQVYDQNLHIADVVEKAQEALLKQQQLRVKETANQNRRITQLTNENEEHARHISDVEEKAEKNGDELKALLQERQLWVKETTNQNRRINQLTNENEEYARRISELEVQLARKDVELQASIDEVTLQDDKVNRVIHKVITNTEDMEQMQVEQKTTTEAVTRCEHKVVSLEKKVDYLGLPSVGGDDTLPSENCSYETTEAIEEGQLPVTTAAIQIDE